MATGAVVRQTGTPVRAVGVIWLVIGIVLLIGAAAALYFSRDDSQLRAYSSAPACASVDEAIAGKDCRYTAMATVTGINGDGSSTYVSFDLVGESYTPFGDAAVPRSVQPDVEIPIGSQVQVVIWRQQVTRIANLTTAANPVNDPRQGNLGAIGLLLLLLGAGALLMARRMWRDDSGQLSTAAALKPVAAIDLMSH
jgi:hypothetical protein